MKKTLAILLTISTLSGMAQEKVFSNSYQLSKCKGHIPLKISSSFSESLKHNEEKDESLNRKNKKLNSKFYKSSNFHLDQLLRSGKVLFGDEMTNYVQEVAHNILDKAGKGLLKKELSFFVLKSKSVNAFAMQDGSIFVTVGLLSHIKNEAQLAFVLSHEIAHYERKHNIKFYRKSIETRKNRRRGVSEVDELLKTLSNYSKSAEFEADEYGLKTFVKSGYDTKASIETMNVLKYSFLPFDNQKFDTSYFDKTAYTIPKDYFESKKSTDSISDVSKDDDTYSSHPNISKRIARLDSLRKGYTTSNKEFIFSKKKFKYINTKARFEAQSLGLIEKDFLRVIFESHVLQKQFPNNTYLKKCIALGLYGAFKIRKSNNSFADEIIKHYDREGEILAIKSMLFNNMSLDELALLTISRLEDCNDTSLNEFRDDVIYDLLHDLNFKYKRLVSKEKYDQSKKNKKALFIDTTFTPVDSLKYSQLNKVDKLEYKKKHAKLSGEDSVEYFLTIFSDKSEENEPFISLNRIYEEKKKKSSPFFNWLLRKRQNLDSIMVLEPIYIDYKTRVFEEDKIFHEESVRKRGEFKKSIEKVSLLYDKRILSLESSNIDSIKIEHLNANFIIKEWYSEIFENQELDMLSFSKARAKRTLKSFDCKNVMITVILDDRRRFKKTFKFAIFLNEKGEIIYSDLIRTLKKGHPILKELFINDVFSKINK